MDLSAKLGFGVCIKCWQTVEKLGEAQLVESNFKVKCVYSQCNYSSDWDPHIVVTWYS